MGKGESKFLYITTNSTVYSPGECIHGEVYLKLEEDFPSECLNIHIEGHEWFSLKEKTKEISASQEIFTKNVILYYWDNGIAEKGDYVFPFNFKLPNHIPGSTSIDLPTLTASIQYCIKASLSPDFFKEKEFSVKSKSHLSHTLMKNQSSALFVIKRCCCITRATIDMQLSTNKFEYTKTDIMRIEIRGLCTLNPFVLCFIYRNVRIMTEGCTKVIKTKIYEFKAEEDVVDLDLRILEGRIGKNTSTEGRFVSCAYEIKVVAGNSCSGRNEVTLPFQFNSSREEPETPRYSIPWKPNIVKCQLIEEAYSYDEGFSFYNSNFE